MVGLGAPSVVRGTGGAGVVDSTGVWAGVELVDVVVWAGVAGLVVVMGFACWSGLGRPGAGLIARGVAGVCDRCGAVWGRVLGKLGVGACGRVRAGEWAVLERVSDASGVSVGAIVRSAGVFDAAFGVASSSGAVCLGGSAVIGLRDRLFGGRIVRGVRVLVAPELRGAGDARVGGQGARR